MQQNNYIRTLLQLTQKDMAAILGMSRGYYAMFEIGKRSLPMPAKALYAALLTKVQSSEKGFKRERSKGIKQQQIKRQQVLKRLLSENEYQQLVVARKIVEASRKQDREEKGALLVSHLKEAEMANGKMDLSDFVLRRTLLVMREEHISELIQFEIRQQVLAFEKSLLESELTRS